MGRGNVTMRSRAGAEAVWVLIRKGTARDGFEAGAVTCNELPVGASPGRRTEVPGWTA